ncbi:hypothetical protein T01_2052 [Trichinella spiralis]|uniref:Uncharacterized protein n=1 Tax=Trichinella spiralis TaxID=6334 RepID=A0A0V1C2Z2_TRISP|nr:hypothetical protein T01_2052 [Trichinella spiralis]
MHSQQYSITVLICRRSKKNYPKIKGTTTLVILGIYSHEFLLSWANRNRIPHSGWLNADDVMIGYSTTNALGKFLQISDAKVVYDLKQSAAKGGDAYSTLANAKWDNPLSSISDVEAVLGYFKRDCWFRRSISSVKNNKSMKLWKLRLRLYSTCLKAVFACLRRYFSFLRKIIPEHFLPRTCNGKLATMATGQLISGHQSIHANYVQLLLHWLYTVIRC